jgi:pullulanase/glycogen debranching enzyme
VVPDLEFDWKFDKPLKTPLADSIIYELHVRGFTAPFIRVGSPGTYAGLSEKIPYLKSLGVTNYHPLMESAGCASPTRAWNRRKTSAHQETNVN